MKHTFTHAELVKRAAGWLKNRNNCRFVVCEQTTNHHEIADCLGFKNHNQSYLVECKVSRADFLADFKKPFRIDPALGMGLVRYYLAPAGLLSVEELPGGWGLLEVAGRKVSVRQRAEVQPDRNVVEELAVLVQCMAMAQANLSTPIHDWLTGPESAYGKLRASSKRIREDAKKRTCRHFTLLSIEEWHASDGPRAIYCTNYPASGHDYCGQHGGKTRRKAPSSEKEVTAEGVLIDC